MLLIIFFATEPPKKPISIERKTVALAKTAARLKNLSKRDLFERFQRTQEGEKSQSLEHMQLVFEHEGADYTGDLERDLNTMLRIHDRAVASKEKGSQEAARYFPDPDGAAPPNRRVNFENDNPLLLKILNEEQKYPKACVFYHGAEEAVAFLYKLESKVNQRLALEAKGNITFLRPHREAFWASSEVGPVVQRTEQMKKEAPKQGFNYLPFYRDVMISANPFLFGNYKYPGSYTVSYFLKGNSERKIPIREEISKFIMGLGLDQASTARFSRAFEELYNREQASFKKYFERKYGKPPKAEDKYLGNGILLQIFIDPEVVDKVAYVSEVVGEPLYLRGFGDKETIKFSDIFKALKEDRRDFERRMCENRPAFKNQESRKDFMNANTGLCPTYRQPEGFLYSNILEARMLVNPEYFNDPTKVKIVSYRRYDDPEMPHIDKEFDRLVDQLLQTWLKESKLNLPTGEKIRKARAFVSGETEMPVGMMTKPSEFLLNLIDRGYFHEAFEKSATDELRQHHDILTPYIEFLHNGAVTKKNIDQLSQDTTGKIIQMRNGPPELFVFAVKAYYKFTKLYAEDLKNALIPIGGLVLDLIVSSPYSDEKKLDLLQEIYAGFEFLSRYRGREIYKFWAWLLNGSWDDARKLSLIKDIGETLGYFDPDIDMDGMTTDDFKYVLIQDPDAIDSHKSIIKEKLEALASGDRVPVFLFNLGLLSTLGTYDFLGIQFLRNLAENTTISEAQRTMIYKKIIESNNFSNNILTFLLDLENERFREEFPKWWRINKDVLNKLNINFNNQVPEEKKTAKLEIIQQILSPEEWAAFDGIDF